MARVIPAITNASPNWKASVDDVADLPATGNETGDTRTVVNEQTIYMWNGAAWVSTDASLSIDDLTDADTSTSAPSVGDHLEWDGNNWVPSNFNNLVVGITGEDTVAVRSYAADQFRPVNASDPITVAAGLAEDSNDAETLSLAFDDTTPEAAKMDEFVPSTATKVRVYLKVHAKANGGGGTVWGLYGAPITTTVGAYSAVQSLGTITHGADENYDELPSRYTEITIANLGLTAGEPCLLVLSRVAGNGSDNLVGDAELIQCILEWAE